MTWGRLYKDMYISREAEKTLFFGASRPRNTIQYGAKAENTIWGQSRKHKQEANAENTSGPHDVVRPPPAGATLW